MAGRVKIQMLVLAAAVALSFFVGIGHAALFNKDEGAFCEATREMMASGNYVMTYLNGAPRFDKPILIYWCQAASVKLFGMNEFAFRFPSAVAAALWALIAYLFARRVLGADKAFLATLFLVTAAQVSVIAKAAIADALLNLCIAAAMFCIFLYYQTDAKRYIYLSCAAMAVGMLTKGPVAVLIPFAVSFLFCWRQRALRRWFRVVTNPVGILIFVAIAAPWYIAVFRDQGWDFFNGFIMKHNVKRFGGSFEGHAGSLFYYIPVVLIGTMPYTTLTVKSLAGFRAAWRDPLKQFCLIWFVFVMVLFSFSGTKLPHYAIYGYTPFFLLMACAVDTLRSDRWLLLPAAAVFGALALLPMALPFIADHTKDEFAAEMLSWAPDYMGWDFSAMLLAALAATLGVAWTPRLSRPVKLAIVGLLSVVIINFVGMNVVARIMHEPVKEAAEIARKTGGEVVLWKTSAPSFWVYYGKQTEERIPRSGDLVFTEAQRIDPLGQNQILYEKNGYVLARLIRLAGT
jgi:4-amino-4-deoxy-L-arabinose transferase-like glycosyltransferase